MKAREMLLMVALVLSLAVATPVLAADTQRCGDGGISQVQGLKWNSLADLIRWVSLSKSLTDQTKYLKMAMDLCKEIQFRPECRELAVDFGKNLERCHFAILHNDRGMLAIAWDQMNREFVTLFQHHTGVMLDKDTFEPVR